MLSTEVSNAVMFQLARLISVIFALEHQSLGTISYVLRTGIQTSGKEDQLWLDAHEQGDWMYITSVETAAMI